MNFRSFFNQVLFPQSCLLCAASDGGDLALCPACLEQLPWHPADACPQCALPTHGGEICGQCLRAAPSFDRTRALFRYAYPIDALLQQYKYRQSLHLAKTLSALMAASGATAPANTRVIPMPLHPRRLAERGFNQSLEIARLLARALSLRLDPHACRRTRFSPPQASLPLRERVRNMRGAFRCDTALTGERIILIDDVMTTGASLHALAGAVKAAGAVHVECWVVARTLAG